MKKQSRLERFFDSFALLLSGFMVTSISVSLSSAIEQNVTRPDQNLTFILDGYIRDSISLNRLNEELVLTPSASITLQNRCDRKNPAQGIKLTAKPMPIAPKPSTPAIRALLKAGPDEVIRFRHVLLSCGAEVFSEADNWYVPGRLDRELNWALDNSRTPFGILVRKLNPVRINLSSEAFLPDNPKTSELTNGGEARSDEIEIPQIIMKHRAILQTERGPISLVEEHYYEALLER